MILEGQQFSNFCQSLNSAERPGHSNDTNSATIRPICA
jgi:hypothetical protein